MSDEVYVPGKGNPKPKIVFIGECPSYADLKAQTPFSGTVGRYVDAILAETGIKKSECWFTLVSKYFVQPQSKEKKLNFATRAKLSHVDLEQQVNELLTELGQLQPNLIVPMGRTALWALTGKNEIESYRGSILNPLGFKAVPTFSVEDVIFGINGYYRAVHKLDFKRIKEESNSRDVVLPERNLKILYYYEDIAAWFKLHNTTDYWVDTERRNGATICIGFASSPKHAFAFEFFNQRATPENRARSIALISQILAERNIHGQNFGYDRKELRAYGFEVENFVSDVMLKAFTANPELPKNQEFLASIYTREPCYKNEEMYNTTVENLVLGCAKDCAVSCEIDLKITEELRSIGLLDLYDNFIHQLHSVYHYDKNFNSIEQNGFEVNEEVRRDLIYKYIQWTEKNRYELYQLTGKHINTNSPIQVAELLYKDLGIPARKGTNEEVLTQLLGNTVKNKIERRVIEIILEDRRVRKTLSSYLYSPPDFDGKMKTSCYICLETGRSSTQQLDPPTRDKLEYRDEDGKKKRASIGMAFQTITKHGDIGPEIRRMLCAKKGYILIGADLAQAEARVIFLLADDHEALELVDKIDYHALTASWFFGGSVEDYDKKIIGYEKPERFAGKTIRHAGHLGASARRAMLEVNTLARKFKVNYTISEAFAKKALETFHEKQPKIRGNYQNRIRELIEKNRRLYAPIPHGINAKKGGMRIFFERHGEELFRQAYSYIPQRSVSEHTKAAALRIKKEKPHYRLIVEAHDGLLFEVPENEKDEAVEVIRQEMGKPINFEACSIPAGNLYIPVETEVGYNYKDLK